MEFSELREALKSLDSVRLAETLWQRAQYDEVLGKAVMAVAGLRAAGESWGLAKASIDYVRYAEQGHGQIIEEIQRELESATERGQAEFALHVARYAVDRGEAVAENFEDDFDWTESLDRLREWVAARSVGPAR